MELIYGENFQYSHPHVTYYLIDESGIDEPAPAAPDSAILVTGLLAPEGLDDGFIRFSGAAAPSNFNNMYGDISIKKHGLMGEFARRHIQNGGTLLARRLTAPDAALANALVSMRVFEENETKIYIDSEGKIYQNQKWEDDSGNIYNEGVEGSDPISELTLDTYSFDFSIKNKEDVNEPGELDISALAETILEFDEYIEKESIGEYNIESFSIDETENTITVEVTDSEGILIDSVFSIDESVSTDGDVLLGAKRFYVIDIENNTLTLEGDPEDIDEVNDIGEYTFFKTKGRGKVNIPLFGIPSLGRGKFGNDLTLYFNQTRQNFNGHRIFNYQLANTKKGKIEDDYDLSHVPELSDSGVPINLEDIVSQFSGKVGLTLYDDNYNTFDVIFEKILNDIIMQLDVAEADPTFEGNVAPLRSTLENQLEKVIDEDLPYLNNMEILNGDMFRELSYTWTGVDSITGEDVEKEIKLDLNFLFPNDSIGNIPLGGGHDGSLEDMKRFDWNFEDENGDNIVTDMFSDLYSGVTDRTIMDLQKVDGDGILDVGYPLQVKEAISGLVNMNRQDMFYIMGIPKHIKNIDMLELWTSAFNPHNEQMMKVGQTGEWRDNDGRIHRVPVGTLLYLNLINHFMNGYSQPFAGSNVYISGIQRGSLLPKMNGPEDRHRMENMNYNVVSQDKNGYFLDGQITNYIGGYSRLKEFFNIPIKGRMMKTSIPFLEARKHKLNTPDNVEKVRKDLERTLDDFYGNKVVSISVDAGFRNEQEEIRGDVTVEVFVTMYGSIKRFRLITYIN